jgi:predicted helicase
MNYEIYQTTPDYGYYYVRENEYWNSYKACKAGISLWLRERENTYITSEVKKGMFALVIRLDSRILTKIEKQFHEYFTNMGFHIYFDGSATEIYKKDIIDYIVPYLINNNIDHTVLTDDEINDLTRKPIKSVSNNDNVVHNDDHNDDSESSDEDSTYDIEIEQQIYIPRNYQTEIIQKSVEYFKTNQKGLLILPCGVGKTLCSLWIATVLNTNTIVIGVPNRELLNQWRTSVSILFPNVPVLIVSGGVSVENISDFISANIKCIVITTYSSSHKVYNASQNCNFSFDIKINDEVHHLTCLNMSLTDTSKKYIQMLKINSIWQLSLTATLKLLENKEHYRDEDIVVSNDNIDYFGHIIDKRSLLWSINEKIICDYVIQTIVTNEEQIEQQLKRFNITEENDKRLFLSAYASLKSISDGHSHHLLIYNNNKENSEKTVKYINMLLDDYYFDIPGLYYSMYNSDMNSKKRIEILDKFKKSEFGIITCVYCLSEGCDFPVLDGVVFAENMTSNIRIVQSALRPCRKNSLEPNKIAKIILPILNREDWLDDNDNQDLKKVREVIYQMGLEDETISQKIKVSKIYIEKNTTIYSKERKIINKDDEFGEYDEYLTSKLKLRTVKRTSIGTTYEKAKQIIVDKNIKTKEAYFSYCENDNRLTTTPEVLYNGKFVSWIDYLSIPRIYYELNQCKTKVSEYLSLHPKMHQDYLDLSKVCKELCKLDASFPPHDLWLEYYHLKELREIITLKNLKKKTGVVL